MFELAVTEFRSINDEGYIVFVFDLGCHHRRLSLAGEEARVSPQRSDSKTIEI